EMIQKKIALNTQEVWQEKKYMNHQEESTVKFSTENPYTKELNLGMNLDDKKKEQPTAEVEVSSSFLNNKKTEQPRTEIGINNSAKSTQFMLSEEMIQKKIALNTQEVWQENSLHNPLASLYNSMPMDALSTNTKQGDSDGFKV
ncbi:8597_t:CDS:1, partial [Cetraspora pellucida]